MPKGARKGLAAGAVAIALALTAPSLATARDGVDSDNTGDGYEVGVEVTFTGDGAPGDGGSYTVYVEPVCWWEPIPSDVALGDPPVDATDPTSVYEWYQYIYPLINGSFSVGRLAFPPKQEFLAAIAREEAGEDLTWYHISSDSEDVTPCSPHVQEVPENLGGEAAVTYAAFVATDPPEPVIDPEELAIEAREIMEIDEPEVDRNPKIVDGPDQATFVNIPTWFWVTDPETVGDENGQRTIRAEIDGSNVWAEVTAETGGLSIASPAGSRHCVPELAKRQWEPGANDADGCTVEFNRASVGHPDGYTVTATTEWEATWEGEDADGNAVGGELDPLTRSATTLVPVAEVQSIVKRVGG